MKWFRILVSTLVAAFISTGAAAQTRDFNIPPGELKATLDAFAKQSGLQLVYRADEVGAVRSNGVTGSFSREEALARILEGTGFTSHQDSSGAIAVVRARDQRGERPRADLEKPVQLEGIVVTAQKRDERAFDVPISIVAMTGDELQKRKVTSLDDLSLAVPGLAIQSSGSFQRRIMLRGISNTFGSSSLIGVYLDEASVTSAFPVTQLDLRTHDLERVEVLRGPQGTLYGEGSAGGTIRFITKAPVLDRFSMTAGGTALWTTEGAPGQRIETMLNVPLITDEMGLRIAGTFDHQGGWIDQSGADRKDYNDQNLVNVRVKGLWQPTPQFSASAMAITHRNDAAPNVGEDADGNYRQVFNLTTTPNVRDRYEIYNLTLSYDAPLFQVLNTTSYIDQYKELRNQGFRFQLTPPGTPAFDALFHPDTRSGTTLTEELRLVSQGSGPWQWTVGGYYQRAEYDRDLLLRFASPIPPGAALPAASSAQEHHRSEAWAAFGDASYQVTNRLTLGAGVRYYENEREFTAGVSGVSGPTQSKKFDSLDPRVYARYRVSDDLNTYATAAKGFRSGGFNAVNRPPFDPESIWTYELGSKLLLGRTLAADLAVFYSDYQDYQIVGFVPVGNVPVNITSNAGNARIKGVELAVTWVPADRWSLGFNGSYVNSKFVEINATTSSHMVGDPLDLFPKYGYTLSVQRDFDWRGRLGFVRVDYNEQGRMTYRNRRSGPWVFDQSDVINMLNLHVNLALSKNLSLSLFGRNLLNDRGYTDPFAIDENAARARPRTLGIGFSMTM